mmetsp:Transcript_65429/g.109608  ORF Transcript_65429/g.109608 Transcript_65429/m.109608 type:complete len:234 (-) Transcript_65429:672-1373(-)
MVHNSGFGLFISNTERFGGDDSEAPFCRAVCASLRQLLASQVLDQCGLPTLISPKHQHLDDIAGARLLGVPKQSPGHQQLLHIAIIAPVAAASDQALRVCQAAVTPMCHENVCCAILPIAFEWDHWSSLLTVPGIMHRPWHTLRYHGPPRPHVAGAFRESAFVDVLQEGSGGGAGLIHESLSGLNPGQILCGNGQPLAIDANGLQHRPNLLQLVLRYEAFTKSHKSSSGEPMS